MKRPLNVFFAFGKFFIQYFTVSLTSLLETNKDLDLRIFLIYDFEDKSLLSNVLQFVRSNYGIELQLIYQDSKIFNNYRVSKHVSINTYLRLLLTDIIPNDIDSGLFLDSDTVVTGSLAELAKLKFKDLADVTAPDSEKFLYAVSEIPEQRIANSTRLSALGFGTDTYFNAGIMLVNLKNWRLINASAELMKLAERYMDDLVFWDQDVLNMYFANRWGELDATYNALHLIWKRKTKPLIVHFAGSSKPWNYLDRHPYKAEYFKYLRLTPFKDKKYVDFSLKRAPYKYYRELRHSLNYFRQLFLGKLKESQSSKTKGKHLSP